SPVVGVLPRPPKTWPAYETLGEWGCETCHTPHFAPTASQLLAFTSAPPAFSCTTSGCHGTDPGGPPHRSRAPAGAARSDGRAGRPAGADRGPEGRRARPHPARRGAGTPGGGAGTPAAASGVRRVVCADCHEPPRMTDRPADPPGISGLLAGVSGVDRNGIAV